MGRRGNEDSPIPEAATEAVNATLANIDNVRSQLNKLVSISVDDDDDVLAQMGPLARAQSLLFLARTISHSSPERLKLYQNKLNQCIDFSKEPSRPSAALNHQAATRFVEHSLPDLTVEQKQNMRNISRGEATKSRLVEHNDTQKRQKHQSNEKQYIEAGTEGFLARDICGPSRTRTNVKNQLQLKTTAVEEKME